MVPTFETKRLILKPLSLEDAPAYKRHFVDWEVIQHLSQGVPWPYPEDGVELHINRVIPQQGKDKWVWGIFLKENPSELIGCVDLWRKGYPENRGFWLGKKFWGRGIMTEATAPITAYAFNELGFDRLIFANALGNERSRRIKEKTGCHLLRVEPQVFRHPAYTQQEVWELTKEDWLKYQAAS